MIIHEKEILERSAISGEELDEEGLLYDCQ